MANNWDEFFTTPIKASKKLHVTAKDVKRGAQIDARRREAERQVAEQSKTTPTGLPYGTTPRPSGVPSDAPSLYAGELAKSAPSDLISNALLAGNLGGVSAAFGALAPLRTGLAVGAGADAVLGAKAGEGDIPAVLSGAGMLGRRALPVALATGAAYAADAEAMPFVKYLKYLKNNKGEVGATPLFKNPTTSEIGELWKSAREDSFTNDITPTLRIMRDLQTPDTVYAWDGTKLLHKDVADQLGLPFESLTGAALERGQNTEEMIKYFQGLKPGAKFAGGGLVKSGLKMMFPNLGAPLHVVKPKGGNWLSGSVEDALRPLQRAPGVEREGVETFSGMTDRAIEDAKRTFVMDDWIEGPLTKYVKTRMASPDDEVRRLADQGILHVDQDSLRNSLRTPGMVSKARIDAGFPEGGMSPLKPGERTAGYDWENASDSFIISGRAGSYANTNTFGGKNPGPTYLRDNPWLATVPPETPVYDFATRSTGSPQLAPSLGFDHLIDELRNALDPNSGLPRHLQLTPEAVKNLSMEKAVRRVADINAWRAAQIAEANGKIAGGPGQELVREYPHTPATPNPKGLRWVELKQQDVDPTLYTLREAKFADGSPHYEYVDKTGEPVAAAGRTIEEAAKNLKDTKGEAALQQQLRYEGDTMGHCVGGYCDDVISGRSRIFSLRDAKGEPHVTVEVGGQPRNMGQQDIPDNYIEDAMQRLGIDSPEKQWGREEEIDKLAGDLWKKDNPDSLRIVQIKGKQNRKPNDEYLPFVQDFVKNPPHGAPWDEVGDLQNTGMFKVQQGQKWPGFAEDMPEGFYTLDEAHRLATEKGMDPEVLDRWMAKLKNPYQEFASGGSVGVPAAGWELLTDPTGSPAENKLSWDIFSGHNDAEQLEALE